MEILSSSTFTEPGDLGLALTILFSFVLLIGLVVMLTGVDDNEGASAIGGLILVVISGLAIWGTYDVDAVKYVKHEVIVNDYNEVFKQGYEVVDQDGKITTIRKEVDTDGDSN